MKRKIITLLLAISASSLLCTSAMAAGINGFYDVGTASNVEISAYAGDTQVSVSEKNIDEDDAAEKVYLDSDRLDVKFNDATADDQYGIILVEGNALPTKDTAIYYINQEAAGSSSIGFNVYPTLPTETKDMTLYISSSAEDFDLISVPVNYAVNATEVSSHKPGDANGDNLVDVKDVISIRRAIAGGYNVTINEKAANVNGDTKVDVKDAIAIRRFIAGGYDIELK